MPNYKSEDYNLSAVGVLNVQRCNLNLFISYFLEFKPIYFIFFRNE